MRTKEEIEARIKDLAENSFRTIDGNSREIKELLWVLNGD
jgi:hypothetical protein